MGTVHAVSLQTGVLADEALDLYVEHQRHTAICRQCRLDPQFCDTGRTYEYNFYAALHRWKRSRA